MRRAEKRGRAQRPRRLWIVNHYAAGPDQATGTRHFDLAKRLVDRGIDITIFASAFSHVSGRDDRLRSRELYRAEVVDGVRFVWIRTLPYAGNGPRRSLNMVSFAAAFLVVQSRFRRPDVVIGSTVHPFAAFAAWMIAAIRRSIFIFEVRDLWPQTLIDLGAMDDRSPGAHLLRTMEALLVRRAAYVITLLPGISAYLGERGLPVDKARYIPNGVDLAVFDRTAREPGAPTVAVAAARAAIERLHADGRLVFGYVGALGRVNDVATLIRAAELAESRSPGRIGLVVIGDGAERVSLESAAQGLSHVAVLPSIPKRAVPGVLRAIDVGVVHTTWTPVYRYGISFNKLFEYFAAQRPVLFACSTAYDPVGRADAGITVEPDDPDLVAAAMLRFETMGPEARTRMGVAGREYVEREHDIAELATRVADLVVPGATSVA